MKTSDRLRLIREALEISAPEFAARLGYFNAGSYRNIENGATEIGEKLIMRLQKSVPQLNMAWFENGTEPMFLNIENSNSTNINNSITEPMRDNTVDKLLDIILKQRDDIRYSLETQRILANKLPNMGEHSLEGEERRTGS